MLLGILKETGTENRVAMLPGEVALLRKLGLEVLVEKGAGERAYAADSVYQKTGAEVVERKDVITRAAVLLSVNTPVDDMDNFREGQIICCVLNQVENKSWLENAKNKVLSVLALDIVPRTTRAQSMDILSSMATVSG